MPLSLNTASANEFLQWDVKTFDNVLRYWNDSVSWSSINKCLELGAREGGLSLWLATRNKNVVCSDLHNSQQTAIALHSKYETKNLITYQDIDASNIPYEDEFDLIIFKSVLGGIGAFHSAEKQKQAIDSIYKALKPGGVILFAENLEASALHRYLRKRFTDWGANWRYTGIEETKSFFSAFSKLDFHTTGFLATLGRNETQRNLLHLGDKFIFNHILPSKYHYLCYGIATK